MHKLRAHFHELQARLPADGPGFSAVVLRAGETAFELHHGMASLELQVPLCGDSAYYLASESKQFTAACMLTLVRQGRIGLDDDVSPHLPELAKFEQAFPLRSLLQHSSGIPDYFQFLACQLSRHDADYFDNAHILRLIACMDSVDFPPLSGRRYSNSNYILLAALIERLTGMSLGRYARATLFDPLDMRHLRFDEDRFAILPRRVFSYELLGAAAPAGEAGYRQFLGNANTVGDGGVYGSTNELVRWEREWHRQWDDPASLLHAMLQPSPLADGTLPDYRFGLEWVRRGGQDVVFHGGGLWGFDTLIVRIPALRLSVIHLANCEAAQSDLERIVAAALGKHRTRVRAGLSPSR